MIALEGEFVVDATEFLLGRYEYRLDVPLEAANPPGSKELSATETNRGGDTKLTDVGQSLLPIEVGSIDTERGLPCRKRLGGRYKPQPGVTEVTR